MPLLVPMKKYKLQKKGKSKAEKDAPKTKKSIKKSADKLLNCHLCNFSTKTNNTLKSHMKTHDSDSASDEYDDVVYKNPFVYDNIQTDRCKVPSGNPKLSKEWVCLFCDKNLGTKVALIEHYSIHTSKKLLSEDDVKKNEVRKVDFKIYQCNVCPKEFASEERYGSHLETHSNLQLICEDCKRCFKYLYEYSVHSRVHNLDCGYKCYLCDFSTVELSEVKPHLKQHRSIYKYKCDKCEYVCNIEAWLEEHRNVHSGVKPFTCEYCAEAFCGLRELMAHKRDQGHFNEHKNEGSYECEHCHRLFPNEKILLLHVKRHKVQSCVLCDICGKGLSSRYHLNIHRRIHTGYKPFCCTICGKSFSKKSNLTLHERVHSGEKPYQCTYCEKSFSQRSTLVIHTRYHTGDRPYSCHICKKSFVCKGLVTMHLKNCNGIRSPASSVESDVE